MVNHARWDQPLPSLLLKQFARPSFRSFVLANLLANRTGAMPILLRRARPLGGPRQTTDGGSR
jgi:hypothetical protein